MTKSGSLLMAAAFHAGMANAAIVGPTPYTGVADNAGGIARLVISMPTSADWEVDHLQIGTAVPQPGTWAMLIAGFGMVGAATRLGRRTVVA